MKAGTLNKSYLNKQRQQLRLYQKVLPSLDLKRRQLSGELARAQAALAHDQRTLEELLQATARKVPMLASEDLELAGLVRLEEVEVGEENVVGVTLPRFQTLRLTVRPYSLLAKPHWVDVVVVELARVVELRARVAVGEERVRRLAYAVRKVTQRVNLFEKILIPDTQKTIQRIRIFLGDAERAAVVRSKIAKARHHQEPVEAS